MPCKLETCQCVVLGKSKEEKFKCKNWIVKTATTNRPRKKIITTNKPSKAEILRQKLDKLKNMPKHRRKNKNDK